MMYTLRHLVAFSFLLLTLALAGCGSAPKPSRDGAAVSGGGYYKDDGPGVDIPRDLHAIPNATPRIEPYAPANMRPYTVMGQRFVPISGSQAFTQKGVASWYGRKFHGRKTANGETYDMYAMTAAHPTLPLPSYARVTRTETGQSVIVRINDRGPFLHSRIIDLSYAAAAKLGLIAPGSGHVLVEAITHDDIRRGLPASPAPAATAVASEPDPLERLARAQQQRQAQAQQAIVAANEAPLAEPAADTHHRLEPISGQTGEPQIFLQFGAFSTEQNANALINRLNTLSPQSVNRPAQIELANNLYRVQLGPYNSRTEAVNAALSIQQESGLDSTLTIK